MQGKHDILIFIKHYDPDTERLRYIGRAYFHKNTKLSVSNQGGA